MTKKIMVEDKPLLKSKTVWGGLIAIVPALADAIAQLAGMPLLPPQLAATIGAIGGSLAILGRLAATVRVKF